MSRRHSCQSSGRAAFTLVEIILAIGLATSLLLVAMTFYHQAAGTRTQVLRELEQVSTLRLVMDRLASDLRTAQPKAGPGHEFTGDATSMTFIKVAYVGLPSTATAGGTEPTDLVRVTLTTLTGTNGTRVVVNGLDRNEAPLNPPAAPAPTVRDTNSFDLFTDAPEPVVLFTNAPESLPLTKEPFGDILRFVRFRYWDGSNWQAGWTNASPPAGVEILLSLYSNAEDAEPDAYPADSIRRVVFVPGGLLRLEPDTNVLTSLADPGGDL